MLAGPLGPLLRARSQQLPPPYSAKKTGGRKFYELARAGEAVPREPKRVHGAEHRADESRGPDRLGFAVTCSSGTYLRSLAHDIGETLGCGGHLASLRRVRIGPWRVEDAVSAEMLANRPHEIPAEAFVSLASAILPFPEVILNPTAMDHFVHGQEVVGARSGRQLRPRVAGGRAGPCRRARRRGRHPRLPFPRPDRQRGPAHGACGLEAPAET